ncbi:MAG: hypothetical protein GY913_36080 [Proteobacteria bacterium]|nr:hypothetical protein [Pseudomonadota bacterium]MCP4922350.1 hypothetical protein [Pseudomonadota bacterium]
MLRRGSFTSQADLEARLRTCINYYFVVEARPHRSKTSADDMLRKMRIGSSELLS